ncbi:MerR family transcriptional regulator [Anaerovirgula multivorans]|nr:helix-turn-helix domain-containing protein [Anaerovirgula multivorans]
MNEIYSIKEISEITGFKPHVIRYYEKEFDLEIPRNESNRRFFTYKELEELRNIKTLQEKGLTNKQIKQVLKSPEIVMNEDNAQEIAASVANLENSSYIAEFGNENLYTILKQLFAHIQQIDYKKDIEELYYKIDELQNQLVNQEKDVLICENAKLKMKIKEKSYEMAELKEKLKREENKKVSIFAKIFGSKQ